MLRRRLPLCLIGLLLLEMTAVHAQAPMDKVRVVQIPFLGNSPSILADAEGYFAEQGIELENVKLPDTIDASALSLMLQGQLDVMTGFVTPGIFNAIQRGANVRVVGDSGYNKPNSCSYWSFVLPAGTDPATFDIASLKGKHVAITPGSPQYYLDQILHRGGLTLADVTIDNIPAVDRSTALANGSAAAAWLSQPVLPSVQMAGEVQPWLGSSDLAAGAELSVLDYGPTMLERTDDLPIRFMEAYIKGLRQANEGPTQRNIDILAPVLHYDPELMSKMCWQNFKVDGSVNTDSLMDYQNWLHEQGQIDSVLNVDQFYDPSFAQKANALLPEVTPEIPITATAEVGS